MKRAENPILLWLIEEADERAADEGYERSGQAWWLGLLTAHLHVRSVCRWLDAEDAWVETFDSTYRDPFRKVAEWKLWRSARMAEAGVL